MRFVELYDTATEQPVHVNPDHVVSVKIYDEESDPPTSVVQTVANANGLHLIYVQGTAEAIVAKLEGRL